MNNIKKLIGELEDRLKSHLDNAIDSLNDIEESKYDGKYLECDFIIQKLKLLLKDESKQPQPPDFANTALGEVPEVVNAQPGENLKAVEGATPVVRQNEQTKELLLFLKFMKENKHRYMLTDEKRFVDEFQKQRLAASALDK